MGRHLRCKRCIKTLMFLALAISTAYSADVKPLYYSEKVQRLAFTRRELPKESEFVPFENGGLYVMCSRCEGGGAARDGSTCKQREHYTLFGRADDKWFALSRGEWVYYDALRTSPITFADSQMKCWMASPLASISPDWKTDPVDLTEKQRDDLTNSLQEAAFGFSINRRLTATELLARRKPSRPRVVLERLLEE